MTPLIHSIDLCFTLSLQLLGCRGPPRECSLLFGVGALGGCRKHLKVEKMYFCNLPVNQNSGRWLPKQQECNFVMLPTPSETHIFLISLNFCIWGVKKTKHCLFSDLPHIFWGSAPLMIPNPAFQSVAVGCLKLLGTTGTAQCGRRVPGARLTPPRINVLTCTRPRVPHSIMPQVPHPWPQ